MISLPTWVHHGGEQCTLFRRMQDADLAAPSLHVSNPMVVRAAGIIVGCALVSGYVGVWSSLARNGFTEMATKG